MGILDKSGKVQGNMNVQKFIETSVTGIRRVGKGIYFMHGSWKIDLKRDSRTSLILAKSGMDG
jgi:hypothetical protein